VGVRRCPDYVHGEEMAAFTCSCPDAMMAYDSGVDTGLYIVCGLLAMALMAMHGCTMGDDAESEDEDSAPEGMFS
jgi:hypothetical protein